MQCFEITKAKYDYLCRIYGNAGCYKPGRLRTKQDKRFGKEYYFFIGTYSEYAEMLDRCSMM